MKLAELDRQRWEELLAAAPAATFFHTAEWARLWQESYSFFESCFLVDVEPEGGYRAGLPFVRARKWLDNYYSMPMGTCGGVVGGGEEAALYRTWIERTAGARRERLVVISEKEEPALEELGFQKNVHFSHYLTLPSGGRLKFSRSMEEQVGTALTAGFSLLRIEKEEDLSRFFSFSGRGRKKDFYSKVFYRKLAAIFLPGGRALWFLALKEGKTAGYLIGLPFREKLFLWDADFDPVFSGLRPGYFLLARTLDWAANKGFKTIDFGQTPAGAEGAALLKERFGGKRRPTYEYVFAPPLKRALRGWYEKLRGRA
ncbi:MAG: GNAT family N-acetyltransferase [candidate division Zixibacteria bacterium]|nr:GNAT family N-acetyltransferase [candidate division Zixibacteria bacterium]